MKKLLLIAAFAAACSSSNNTSNTGTDAAVTGDTGGGGGSACEALCAGASCGADCVAACTAGGAATPNCVTQYNAVVRCAASAGQTCTLMQGGGTNCTAQATAYSTCVAGGSTDAGSMTTDAGSMTSADLVGTWSTTSMATGLQLTLTFLGGPNSGMARYQTRLQQSGSGCVVEQDMEGTWALANGTLTLTLSSGTGETSMCTDSSQDRAQAALESSVLMTASMNYSGAVTVTDTMLTFMGGSMRTFTRASGG